VNHIIRFGACTMLVHVVASSLFAQAIATYDENSSFPFHNADYGQPGAVTLTANSILFDVSPPPPRTAFAGGALALFIPPINFAPAGYQVEARFRILPGNTAPAMGAVLNDQDVQSSETWLYNFPISGYTPADSWITLRQGLSQPYLVTSTGDGILNPDLEALGLVAGGDSPDLRFHLELDYVRIIPVPEPGSLGLMSLGAAIVACRIRRRANQEHTTVTN
jgi:hypothetical protein